MAVEDMANVIGAAYDAEVRGRGLRTEFDEATRSHILEAARWLCDPDGRPGLLLTGSYGNGKSTLMSAICTAVNFLFDHASSDRRHTIRTVEAAHIARLGCNEAREQWFRDLCNEEMLAVEELGEEPAEIIRYGMPYRPVRDFILERYKRQKLTVYCTNLIETDTVKHITEHYGPRVADRMREMMHVIPFLNESYRGRAVRIGAPRRPEEGTRGEGNATENEKTRINAL